MIQYHPTQLKILNLLIATLSDTAEVAIDNYDNQITLFSGNRYKEISFEELLKMVKFRNFK